VIACPNCGTMNQEGSRFCENCGADLRSLTVGQTTPPPPAQPSPPPVFVPPPSSASGPPPPTFGPPPGTTAQPWDLPPTAPEWRMSSLPTEPPPQRKRRTWLWVLIGLIGAIVICCCVFGIWANTAGEEWFTGKLTEVSNWATETSATAEAD